MPFSRRQGAAKAGEHMGSPLRPDTKRRAHGRDGPVGRLRPRWDSVLPPDDRGRPAGSPLRGAADVIPA